MRNTSCPRCNQSPCECKAQGTQSLQPVKAPSHKPITVKVNRMEYKAYLEVTGNAFERGLFDAFEVAKGWLNSRTRRSRYA